MVFNLSSSSKFLLQRMLYMNPLSQYTVVPVTVKLYLSHFTKIRKETQFLTFAKVRFDKRLLKPGPKTRAKNQTLFQFSRFFR